MPPQIVRLVLLTIVIICGFSAAKFVLTPSSFGQYGHYRGNALQEIAARPPFWAGRGACTECHADHVKKLAAAEHKTLSCETCHGPARAHVENPQVQLPKLSFSHCVRCHESNPSRPAWLHQINPHNHYVGQLCTECHVPHQPNEVP